MEDEFIVFKCPECDFEKEIPRCKNCQYSYRNYFEYEEAKECWDCDMFHKNFTAKDEVKE